VGGTRSARRARAARARPPAPPPPPRYALNVGFNLLNKTIFGYFPFPWTVSAVHVVVGLVYCVAAYALGAKKASFGRPVTKAEFKTLLGPASMHAIGHIAANLSFAAVAISLTHTIKTLEPAFNVLLSKAILGTATPPAVMATLLPIMGGVALASASDLSFNWTGFIGAMLSNLTFGFRAVWSKAAMSSIKDLDSTAIYAYTTLISVLICVPGALIFEGPALKAGIQKAVAAEPNFYWSLATVGVLYHLYNQFAFNTLARVSPVSHGVCNVVKRIVIIGASVVFFGTKMSAQAKAGTAIAIAGTWLYTEAVQRAKPKAA
jgi:Tpt phosphate/phosphoenolpyruvate translocator